MSTLARTVRHPGRCTQVIAAGLVSILLPAAVQAQEGFQLRPSIAVLAAHDDNLFFASDNELSGSFTRASPELEAGYGSAVLQALGSYRFDAEYYRQHKELDSSRMRRFLDASVVYNPDAAWVLSSDLSYTRTNTPIDLGPETTGVVPGLLTGRVDARRTVLRPGIGYRFTSRTGGQLDYAISNDELTDALKSRTQSLGIEFNTRLSDTRVFDYGYELRRYRFDSVVPGSAPVSNTGQRSRTAWVGIDQALSPRSSISVRGGPRQVEGAVRPFVLLRFQGSYARSDFSLSLERNETTLLGEVGRVESRIVSATLGYRVGSVLELRLSPGYTAISDDTLEVEIVRVNLEAVYRINSALSLQATFESSHQQADELLRNPGSVNRNLVTLGFTLGLPRQSGTARR